MFLTPSEADLIADMRACLGAPLPPVLGVAVSGGSDSLALLYLLAEMANADRCRLVVATVDHGLRAESHQEARQVAEHAAALGLSHDILTWSDRPTGGNIQSEARAARYRLLAEWSRTHGAVAVAVGHTADDQAETVLMRLRRASGVAGLSAMPVRHQREGLEILRPLLGLRREDLRHYLRNRNLSWIDDPTNRDTRFERVRMREALTALDALGLTVEALTTVADNMRRADSALSEAATTAAESIGVDVLGAIRLDSAGFCSLNDELARRVMLAAIAHVSSATYPPRRMPMEKALSDLRQGRGGTLQGCQYFQRGAAIWLCREYRAVAGDIQQFGADDTELIWDQRWRIAHGGANSSPETADADAVQVRALGEDGIAAVEDWRDYGAPREVMLALPSLWQHGRLVAVPQLKPVADWPCAAIRPTATWAGKVLSH